VKELKALLFDVDGTLADTEKDGHLEAFNRAFADAGLDWNWSVELYGKLLAVTGGKERIKYYLDNFLVNEERDFERPNDLDGFIKDLHAAKTNYFVSLMSEGAVPLRTGVKRLINEARVEGMRLAVATTTTPANVEALLVHALDPDAMSWFEVIAAGNMVPAKKPAADIYFYAMDKLALSPEDCIAFEDSENGILSSRGANLKTIITVNDYTRDHDFTGASIVLDQMGEPDQPFTVIAGDAGASVCLDMALVKRLHSN
jgi:HAD superfamily hydrolase (TIGR01509 family)